MLPLPDPMLARAGRPSGDPAGWVGEFKWDGVRAVVGVEPGGAVRIRSRRGADASSRYPELHALADVVEAAVVLDGEVVALDGGRPSFSRLQRRMHVGRPGSALLHEVPVVLQVFDLLRVDDEDLVDRPWHERRARLEALALAGSGPWAVPPATPLDVVDLDALLAVAAQHGLEGVVVKRRDSRYRPGERTDDWRKVRLMRRQELVVVGYQVSRSGSGLGSLLLAVHDDRGRLVPAGSVGSGLTDAARAGWQAELDARALPGAPLAGAEAWASTEAYRWARPELVAEVRFSEWTPEGRLRQPVYLGRRDDVDPATITRET